jgi:ABC-2 type transport system permease protein
VRSVFRKLKLLLTIAKFNWQQETAYFGNAIVGAITPAMYILSFLLLVSVLFQNISSFAGYSRNEMFFLIFVGQVLFYAYSFWSEGADYMETYVNNGMFDYVLTKPVPSLFYITFHRIKPLEGLINFVGPLTPTWLIVDWGGLALHMGNLVWALLILWFGVVLYQQFQFLTSMICFWTGRSKQANLIVYAASSQSIPLEGFDTSLRRLFLGVVPVYVSSVAASVMLGKTDPVFWTMALAGILIAFTILKRQLWSFALRRYSSASS